MGLFSLGLVVLEPFKSIHFILKVHFRIMKKHFVQISAYHVTQLLKCYYVLVIFKDFNLKIVTENFI